MKRREFITATTLGAAAGLVGRFKSGSATEDSVKPSSYAPVKEVCTLAQTPRSGIALGGIGAGFCELRKNGKFYHWNIFNNVPKGTGSKFELKGRGHEDPEDSMLFFIVRY